MPLLLSRVTAQTCVDFYSLHFQRTHLYLLCSAMPVCSKRKLEKALESIDRSKVDVQVRWHPYQLNPSFGASEPKMEALARKFGPRASSLMASMQANGKPWNINFTTDGKTGNTFSSHRILALAAQQGKQDEMVETLFHAYFETGCDIGDDKQLVEMAEKVGVTGVR